MRSVSLFGALLVTLHAPGLRSTPGLPDPAAFRGPYRVALPGYRYVFPRDHFNHPDFQTEWWYYTGNVKASDGHRFGFELTFFRQGLAPATDLPSAAAQARDVEPDRLPESQRSQRPKERRQFSAFDWPVKDIYLAHFALTDLESRRYFHEERLNRSGPGLAGADREQSRIWDGNWEVRWEGGIQ